MIKKDVRYIIKRIIIGVGIVIVLSCLNGCKVKALENYTTTSTTLTSLQNNNNYNYIGFFEPSNPDYAGRYLHFFQSLDKKSLCYGINFNNKDIARCFNTENSYDYFAIIYSSYNQNVAVFLSNSENFLGVKQYLNNQNIYVISDTNNYNTKFYIKNYSLFFTFNYSAFSSSISVPSSINEYLDNSNFTQNKVYNLSLFLNNTNVMNTNFTDVLYSSNVSTVQVPSFLSFNAIPITTKDVITSYTIQPEFTNFNTDSYIYQYSFDKKRWLSLTENKKLLRINNNSTIYVRIKDKNNNDIIDSANLTITNIGTFYDNQTYNINFSGDYRTENYLKDNMCVFEGSKSDIKEYQIYIDYVPKSSILKYQYQYVPTDSQLNSNNWQNVPSTDNGSMTYVATENGTLYARILDKEDNVLKISTFQVSSIGKIAIDDIDKQCTKNIFQKFSSEIDYGGPVSILFKIPVDLLSSLYNTASTSNTCHPYVISKLMGTNFVLPCINFEDKFGSTIYKEIDAMLCFILSIMFFKFLIKIYNDFISMKDIN